MKRYTAFAVSCMLMCTAFTGCGASDGGNYIADNNGGNNYNNNNNVSSENGDSEISDEKNEDFSTVEISPDEEYSEFIETGFKDPNTEPLSTFSADIDTASYTNVRRLIEDGSEVPENAVRIEEFINYFDYDYPLPDDGRIFSNYVEIADCPWNENNKLMMIGVQGKVIEERKPFNLVFLIDSSGSMASYDKLPLVQTAFSMLAEHLQAEDRISIATYSTSTDIVLAGESGENKDSILSSLYSIKTGGGTNGEGGIELAYKLAEEYFIEGGNNRVIIATDGDLNIGISEEKELTDMISEKRNNGIYLSVLGFGTENYKDNKLEAIADNGDGNYNYIDSVDEAQRVLVQEMGGTLYTIAKDVKFQVEFNPSQVGRYRLIGYDNRIMQAEDFRDNTKDAGEMGSGQSVTVLYEIEPLNSKSTYHGIELEFEHEQPVETNDNGRDEWCKFSVAYKPEGEAGDIYESQLFGMEKYNENPSYNIRLAGAVAEFAMILRNSEYKGSSDYNYILETLSPMLENENQKINELYSLVKSSSLLYT